MEKINQIRQGDLLFVRVEDIPINEKKNNYVLAEGEVTGHLHQFKEVDWPNVNVFVDKRGEIFLEVKKESTLVHEEHGPQIFPPGNWKLIRQQEMTPEGWRQVAD